MQKALVAGEMPVKVDQNVLLVVVRIVAGPWLASLNMSCA